MPYCHPGGVHLTIGGVRERPVCPLRGRGRDCEPAALDRALLGGPSTSPLDGMELDASAVAALVDAQLHAMSDSGLAELVTRLRVQPRCEMRPWNYGEPHQYPCWIVLEHPRSKTGIAYCAYGFGPGTPWGLVWLSEHLSMGDDSGWFPSLEEALRDSQALEDLGHAV